ncbi:ComEC/Rec2 family competence protein [Neorhizobium alkalisoli]|uniref:ComEC/Rec2 family competence protein n=1 Tax=Neorhizobium alkalisoli TaxID=528178 RepID=UPI000CF91DCA|nr:ComEC/Rec2 family competence protein [Neorhizobium alkalisoli]
MPEDTAFPKLVGSRGAIFRQAPALPDAGASGPHALEPFSELRPRLEKRSATYTRSHSLLRGIRRLHLSFPRMLEEEAAHGHAFLFVPVLVGAGAAVWFALPDTPPFWPLFVAFLVCLMLAVATRHTSGILRILPPAAALFLGGTMLAELETWRRGTVVLDSPVTTELTGVVERREVDARGRWRYIVRVERTSGPEIRRPPERVSLLARARHEAVQTSDTISGRVRLSPPSGPALPGLNDFAFSSYFDGIGAVGFFYGAPKRGGDPGLPHGWLSEAARRLFDLRSMIAGHIRATVPGDAGAFAAAIVTDERRAISEETVEALRLSGLAHIVAISGLNMALAAGIFFVGVRTVLSLFTPLAQAFPVKKLAALGALLMATAYYLISGFGVSAERAYIMMAVMLVAVLFDRPSISLRNVALSALIIIAVSPSEILGPSFQMSFAATAALVAGYALWKHRSEKRDPERLPFRHPVIMPMLAVWNFTAGIFVTSLIGGISTAIFSVEHFHRIATYGLAANLAAMPVISFVVMPSGLIGMLLMPFGLDAPFLKLMGLGLEAVIAIARHVAAWGGDVGIGRQHPWFLVVATAGFLLLTLLRTRLRYLGIPLLAAGLLLSWQERSKPIPDILISDDGTMIALKGSPGIATNRSRPPDFVYDQWKRALLLGDPVKPELLPAKDRSPAGDKLPESKTGGNPLASNSSGERDELTKDEEETASRQMREAPVGRFICAPRAWCASKTAEGVIVVHVEDGRYAGTACDAARIIVAPRARFDRCRSGALMINGKALRTAGALELFLDGSPDIRRWRLHAALLGEERPWTRHRHYDWRRQIFDSSLPEPLGKLVSDSGG